MHARHTLHSIGSIDIIQQRLLCRRHLDLEINYGYIFTIRSQLARNYLDFAQISNGFIFEKFVLPYLQR